LIYNLLKSKKEGESIQLYDDDVKIWEIRKEYGVDYFEDDASSIGYKISVYQESINKMFPEFLVNFDYLERVMENYGFKLVNRDEAKGLGLPEGSGLFGELFNVMLDETKKKRYAKNPYGTAVEMNAYEKKISFLNRYFVYKKVRNVNAEKISLELLDESMEQVRTERKETVAAVKTAKETVKATKPRVKKLSNKLLLVAATEALEPEPEPEPEVAKIASKEKIEAKEDNDKKAKKFSTKKLKLKLEE